MPSQLFSPITLRGLTLKNRVVISPMCMYSAVDGMAGDLHLVHLGRFALGGAGLVFVEATAVSQRGRITHGCVGLWSDQHAIPLQRIAAFLHASGSAAGIQLSHSGFKGSSQRPWEGAGPLGSADADQKGGGPWDTEAVTGEPFDDGWPVPTEMDKADIERLVSDFATAAKRADTAGFDVVELHCAHGYLLHSFLSPLANKRQDDYGGSLENRMRLPLSVIEAVREVWPADKPLFVRISSVDGINVGWSIEDSVRFATAAKERGVDVVDCSSGGMKLEKHQNLLAREPGFHVPYSERVRNEAGIATIAVGLIRSPKQAEAILAEGRADLISIAREALMNPNWPCEAALHLEGNAAWQKWPDQFGWWLMRRARQQRDAYGPETE
ncbi:NADH:flavin oxidoreductase/NADH oxidase [Sinorhizobium sp. GL28]|uniref:NADH:flavin oxidoreductase/NADH oxidase n=1 Tax=Sinorhizobium sp. GL28 TaxID=1358418 RepID=UPI0009EA6F5F|nr:NADH:flavin oxidoreductase/NADH oxidase [Sinorhizobium sp. GL28]